VFDLIIDEYGTLIVIPEIVVQWLAAHTCGPEGDHSA